MRRLTMAEYSALSHDERTVLRRAAFGAPGLEEVTAGFDLPALKAMLIAENEKTCVMPERWTDQGDDDEALDYL